MDSTNMTDKEKLVLAEAASVLRAESRDYYDAYKKTEDSTNSSIKRTGMISYEKYHELNKLAREIDIIVGGL